MAGIERFLKAQDTGEFEAALEAIRSGQKVGHWIWYVFPQLSGLGTSSMSRQYGIRNRAEADAYLRDSTLRARLEAITAAAATHIRGGVPITRLMGSPVDAQKLVSSLTLFGAVARDLKTAGDHGFGTFIGNADEILAAADAQGYPRCRFTTEQLRARR